MIILILTGGKYMETTRNIIILNNLNSENIEQAIIILKNKGISFSPGNDIVEEAQQIIDSYIKKNRRQARRIREVRSIIVLLPVISLVGMLMYLIFKLL